MRNSLRLLHITLAVAGGALVAACGLADLFRPTGPADVVITYTGPTLMSVNETTLVAVSVTVAGQPLPTPRLWITSSDTTIAVLRGDTLIARDNGTDTLTIRLAGSIYTDSLPTLLQQVRVIP
jgi:hypothetical protein